MKIFKLLERAESIIHDPRPIAHDAWARVVSPRSVTAERWSLRGAFQAVYHGMEELNDFECFVWNRTGYLLHQLYNGVDHETLLALLQEADV